MIRIDENLFIDDSLVSCAEYQLFLDEMRLQNRFFQPDHWTENQFTLGHAHTPLLGMRPSDAIAFCQWLTVRETGEWQFRLPTPQEAHTFTLPKEANDGLGYWTFTLPNQEKEFILISPRSLKQTYESTLNLDMNRALDLDLALDRARGINSDFEDPNDELNLAYARAIYRGLDSDMRGSSDRKRTRSKNLASELDLAYSRVLYRGQNSDNVRAQDLAQQFALERIRKRSSDIDIINDIVNILDRNRYRIPNLDRLINITQDLTLYLADDITRSNDYKLASDLYTDLIILKERIRGRLLPFEGIRIVQERKTT